MKLFNRKKKQETFEKLCETISNLTYEIAKASELSEKGDRDTKDALQRLTLEIAELSDATKKNNRATTAAVDRSSETTDRAIATVDKLSGVLVKYFDEELKFFIRQKQEAEKKEPTAADLIF